MRSRLALGALSAAVALACAASADTGVHGGYLHDDLGPRTLELLPSAPEAGSARDAADREIFKQTRALNGTPRWSLATADVDASIPAMLRNYSCAVGVILDPKDAPALTRMLSRLGRDVATAFQPAKDFYRRKRPFLVDAGNICVARTPDITGSFDYPSGHATWGWTTGLVIAQLAPDREGEVLRRAKAFGESRVVCGVHNASAVDAGRTGASALVAALNAEPAFRSDLEAARTEMVALRVSAAPRPQACEAEANLTAKTPW
jgi:acid phosphatase (class A)